MFSDLEKEVIRRSWRLVVPIAETAADLFYRRLFDLEPEYQSLFPTDLAAQKRKLVKMLAFIVHAMDWSNDQWRERVDPNDDLMLVVLALGRRHTELYRIPLASYTVVGEALLWTLDYGLGDAFTPTVRAVVVDTPAGMFGVTQQVLQASTHVLGVLQAEVVANRSFARFMEAVDSIPAQHRPETIGIVINMLQTSHSASLSVFQDACTELPSKLLFDTSIPRHNVFLDSTAVGVPVRHLDEQAPPAIAWLFDNLAAEIVERLHLDAVERKPQPLLL